MAAASSCRCCIGRRTLHGVGPGRARLPGHRSAAPVPARSAGAAGCSRPATPRWRWGWPPCTPRSGTRCRRRSGPRCSCSAAAGSAGCSGARRLGRRARRRGPAPGGRQRRDAVHARRGPPGRRARRPAPGARGRRARAGRRRPRRWRSCSPPTSCCTCCAAPTGCASARLAGRSAARTAPAPDARAPGRPGTRPRPPPRAPVAMQHLPGLARPGAGPPADDRGHGDHARRHDLMPVRVRQW